MQSNIYINAKADLIISCSNNENADKIFELELRNKYKVKNL